MTQSFEQGREAYNRGLTSRDIPKNLNPEQVRDWQNGWEWERKSDNEGGFCD